jgi:predicted O-methyltransferase YrrM
MEFLPEEIDNYATLHTKAENSVLAELNRYTHLNVLKPRMLSGHLQGKILETFSRMLKPQRILEIGTYTGYSAICMAQGLTNDGILHTIDVNDELEPLIKEYVEKSNLSKKIKLHIGKALEIIPQLDDTFDLVFIDADKENYANYYDLVFDKVRPGGLIIADNVLWSGKVTMPESEMDEETLGLHRYNQKVLNDARVDNTLLPVRDGLMMAIKL